MAATVLTLDTFVDRPQVKIDKALYGMRTVGELSILDFHAIGKHGRKIEKLLGVEELTDDQVADLDNALRLLARIILDAPTEILEALTDAQRVQLATTFTKLQEKKTSAPVVEPPEAPTSTGANTSQG